MYVCLTFPYINIKYGQYPPPPPSSMPSPLALDPIRVQSCV